MRGKSLLATAWATVVGADDSDVGHITVAALQAMGALPSQPVEERRGLIRLHIRLSPAEAERHGAAGDVVHAFVVLRRWRARRGGAKGQRGGAAAGAEEPVEAEPPSATPENQREGGALPPVVAEGGVIDIIPLD